MSWRRTTAARESLPEGAQRELPFNGRRDVSTVERVLVTVSE